MERIQQLLLLTGDKVIAGNQQVILKSESGKSFELWQEKPSLCLLKRWPENSVLMVVLEPARI